MSIFQRFHRQPALVLLLLMLVVLACGRFGPTPTQTAQTPTNTPGPSPTPLPPEAPVVADRYPLTGELLPVSGAIDIYFDQPMNPETVLAAFAIEPPIEGTFEWLDNSTLRFTPENALNEAARYIITIGDSAMSAAGLPIENPFSFAVETTGFLMVSEVVPAPGSVEVSPINPIVVVFNQPVVPLGLDLLDSANLPNPLLFNPPVEGSGQWINTSVYQFTPSPALQGSTRYQVSVRDDLTDSLDSRLGEPFSWQFDTQSPDVVEIQPFPESDNIPLDSTFTVRFNQPMDRPSTEAAFSLATASGQAITGRFTWNSTSTGFEFVPNSLLPIETALVASMANTARAAVGNITLPVAVSWALDTVSRPAVVSTRPTNGETNVDPDWDFVSITVTAPLDEASFENNITISPTVNEVDTFFNSFNNTLNLYFDFEPQTTYTITLGAGITDPYNNPLGGNRSFSFTTGNFAPMVTLNVTDYMSYHTAGRPQQLYVTYRNLPNMSFTLSSLSLENFANLTGPDRWSFSENYQPPTSAILRTWQLAPETFLNEFAYAEVALTEDGSSLPPGLYYLQMEATVDRAQHIVVVADANITLRHTFDDALVWLTDLPDGEPVSNRTITFYDEQFNALGSAQTNSNGLAMFSFPTPLEFMSDILYAVSSDGAGQFALGYTGWTQGIEPYQFGYGQAYSQQPYTTYLYTDRPLYRPGQTIEIKGIIRSDDDARYSLPDVTGVVLTVRNDFYEIIHTENIPVNDFGTFTASYTLSEFAGTGFYTLQVDLPGDQSESLGVQVAEYRKPEFEVSLTPAASEVIDGERINVTVDARYFFGGPVANAEVSWNIVRRDYYFPYRGAGYFDFDESPTSFSFGPPEPNFGVSFASGTGTTNANGQFVISLTADLSQMLRSQVFSIEAVVTELADQPIAGRTDVIVHRGDRYVGLQPQQYVATAGSSTAIDVILLDLDQQPVPNEPVTVIFYSREWFSVQEEDDFGNLVWTYGYEDTEIDRTTVTTNANGRAVASYTPATGGTYRILAELRDTGGRRVSADTGQWVSASSYVNWRQDNTTRIELVADQPDYRPGDVAEILIPSPFQAPVQALVTIERGQFFSSEIITLATNSTVYELPITAQHAPNVYVSVTIIAGTSATNPAPAIRMGLINLPVSPEQQTLNVSLTPNTDITGPGDTLTYTLLATDFEGNPVQAEFSLALVDKALLSLAPDYSLPIVAAFYAQRPTGVQASSGLLVALDNINLEIAEVKGGGGGGDGAFFDVRSEFLDTAYWNAYVTTDVNGRAEVEIRLPDNLTTWQMDARGVTDTTLVGQATVDVIATKPLLVRPLTPRFFVVGDQPTIAAVVSNNTGSDISATVSLAANGLTLLSPERQTISVGNGQQVRVEWQTEVEFGTEVDLTFSVSGGGFEDASKPTLGQPPNQTIPVLRYSAPDTVGTAGVLAEPGQEVVVIALPRRYDANQGQLNATLSPSLAAALLDSLTAIESWPRESTEATVSRFLPNIATYNALRNLNIDNPELETRLRTLTEESIQKLVAEQHADGGWGWFVQSPSHYYLSGYVLFGLHQAREAGFTVPNTTIQNGIEYVRGQAFAVGNSPGTTAQQLTPSRTGFNRQAFLVYVLALYGETPVGSLNYLFELRGNMSQFGLAYLALAYGETDPANANLQTLLNELSSAAVRSATGVQWHEESPDRQNLNTDLHTTAVVLNALTQLNPESTLLPETVRWLMQARNANQLWPSSFESAWSILALANAMQASGELEANYTYGVALNNEALAEGQFSSSNLTTPVAVSRPISDLPTRQASRLQVAHGAGPGLLYYTAFLTVFQDVADLPAQNRGLVVARSYSLVSDSCGRINQRACPTITSAQVGQPVQVSLTIVAPVDMYFVEIVDTLPAGMEVINTQLSTTSQLTQPPTFNQSDAGYYGWGWWWFTNINIRDTGVELYADYLPAGAYTFTYTINPSLPGVYNVIPAIARQSFFPDVYGRSTGDVFTIEP